MIPVAEALDRLFSLVSPLGTERVDLADAAGRVLAEPVKAPRDEPPTARSAMDGYAVRAGDVRPGAVLQVVGEAPAGAVCDRAVGPGEAVRIFTGGVVPEGADRVVIQEDVTARDDRITIGQDPDPGPYVRPAGGDFRAGMAINGPRRLGPADLALLGAMNAGTVCVTRRPEVAVLSTGNELVLPGQTPRPDQIVSSNAFGLSALIEMAGGRARRLPIAADRPEALDAAFDLARGADLIVTIGGASVGAHDLVAGRVAARGGALNFHKVAMRPGKPLMAGRVDNTPMVGVPGNPVSALVCGQVFVAPMVRAMLGFAPAPATRRRAPLAADVKANGPREHYMRAQLTPTGLMPAERQDSSLLSVLADANALLIRPPADPAQPLGTVVDYLPTPGVD
ncbi:MAG: gephyrin-like molybdotransferase Glp [Pseudomonadota bacterium]